MAAGAKAADPLAVAMMEAAWVVRGEVIEVVATLEDWAAQPGVAATELGPPLPPQSEGS